MSASGNATVQYFEGKSFVGEREVYCCGASMGGKSFSAFWPHTAYFCPHCGELWGRAIYQFHFEYFPIPRASWVVESRRCVRCGDGTFLVGQSLENVSEDLLRRELLAILNGEKE